MALALPIEPARNAAGGIKALIANAPTAVIPPTAIAPRVVRLVSKVTTEVVANAPPRPPTIAGAAIAIAMVATNRKMFLPPSPPNGTTWTDIMSASMGYTFPHSARTTSIPFKTITTLVQTASGMSHCLTISSTESPALTSTCNALSAKWGSIIVAICIPLKDGATS